LDKEKINIVKSVFEQALDIDLKERQKFLDDKCGDDKELKKEVLSLLDAHNQTDDFLEIPPNIKEKKSPTEKDQFIGKHIGNYLIEAEAGVGGMGIVYKGKRDDKEFEHKVAIKILRHQFNSEYIVKRFQNERQTLANLQHPNIARLLDGGTTDEGLPYLVMEYIDGKSLIEYCDEKNLNISQRLEIFRLVCGAVQYAHQNLVVHRDIKPGNVLVNKEGRPKLLDFGIAKLMDEELNENEEGLTKTGMWHLTPEYASPEQIKGESITTRSDIYSLGILLYQLLTGHQAYRITVNSPVAIGKIITNEQVIKPSDKFQSTEEISSSDGTIKHITPQSISNLRNEKPEKIFQHLKGDIDNIILKAIHKDPDRRYTSAEQFSEDIRRHLIGLPVIARKDTLKYRFSKFVHRHKVGVAISFLFIAFLILSVIVVSWQASVAEEERDRTKIQAVKFERVNLFLQGMLSSVDPNELGRDVKVYDILDKAAKDIKTELKDQPEIEADINRTLGNTYVNLGEYDKAKPHLYNSLSINENLYGSESKQVAQSLHDIGLYYHWIGDYNLADSLYSKALTIYRKVLTEPTLALAENLNDYALIQSDLGAYDKAEKLFKESLVIFQNIGGEKYRNVAAVMNNLAITLHYKNDLEGAEEYYLKAQKLFIELFGENHPEVGSTYNNLAFVYMDKDDYNRAEEYFYKSYELKLSHKGDDHPDVGLALNNLGVINFKMRDYIEAERYLSDAVGQYRKTYDADHPLIASSHYWLGRVFLETERFDKAEDHLKKSLKIKIKKLPEKNKDIWRSKTELGICLFKKKKYKEAEDLLISSLEFFKTNYPEDTEQLTRLYDYTIKLYETLENKEKADIYTKQFESLSQEID
jgi:serine/threonine protein kinase/tetratricopeptide (TPR) repeat protein